MFRSVLVAACVVVAGCSSSGASSSTESTLVAVAPATSSAPPAAASETGEAELPNAELELSGTATVELSVESAATGIDDAVSVTFDPSTVTELDPFSTFASCSGLRSAVGTYVVTAARPSGDVRAVSVLSVDRAVTAGVHAVEVRVETTAGAPIRATGTMTLDAGIRSGSFLAFDRAGNEVSGGFSCSGGGSGAPMPLTVGADDGVLDAIEVVALLRNGSSERVVSLAISRETAGTATMSCPGASETTGPEIVRVDGDQLIGAITTFELTGEPASTMRLHVGAAAFDFADVDTTIDSSGATGVFSAATDAGVTIDGAFRCS